MSSRTFTLDEAQALLDARVREMAERLVEDRAASRILESRWNAVVIAIGSNGGNLRKAEVQELRGQLEQSHRELRALLAELNELGVEVKDADRGLIDFPAVMDGQDVLLCWQVGEPRIGFWHTSDGGFAGRRPL
ncbi:MAG: DUF2203 domain-containing protein [Gaiellales bacterium]